MRTLTFLFILSLISCNTYRNIPLNSLDNLKTPPGTTEVAENLFFDLTEATNFHWLEYMSWIKKVYGENSEEYKHAIPDQKVWTALDLNYSEFDKYYLTHPSYREYPVVGISYEQALAYSDWRSDRVMQYSLEKAKIISGSKSNNKDSIFTIEKYFTGQYQGYQPNAEIKLYPKYSLPDSASYFKYNQFADSVNSLVFMSNKYKAYSKERLENCIGNNIDTIPFGPSLAKSVVPKNKKLIISHLKGNVREMTNIEGEFYGLSYIDSCNEEHNKIRKDEKLVNSYTGFRNSCVYKEWKD